MVERRVRELIDAYDKLFCLNADGKNDLRWWRLALSKLVCESKHRAKQKTERKVMDADKSF